MDVTIVQDWISANPALALAGALLVVLAIYLLARLVFGRGLIYLTSLTKNKYDDIIAQRLRPYRAAWLAPFIVLYVLAYLSPPYQPIIEKVALFFILWLVALTVNGLLDAANQIYESSSAFTGVSIQGYLDIVKLLVLLVGIILSISLITGESPLLLLSGLGALTAVLLFVFHDTIMSLIASIQISVNDLVKEGVLEAAQARQIPWLRHLPSRKSLRRLTATAPPARPSTAKLAFRRTRVMNNRRAGTLALRRNPVIDQSLSFEIL